MLQMERIEILMKYLEDHKYATVKQIAKDIYMSETTVRRDLKYLQDQNAIQRRYGGAMLVSHLHQTIPIDFRIHENIREKNIIADKAVSLIKPGDTVCLDESSTTAYLAERIDPQMRITVVTYSIRIMMTLSRKNVTTYCTGGLYNPVTTSLNGKHVENFISGFNANTAFFSSTCVSDDGIISDSTENNVYNKQAMLKNAQTRVFLCDHTKFGQTSMRTVCRLEDVDCAISDSPWPETLRDKIKRTL